MRTFGDMVVPSMYGDCKNCRANNVVLLPRETHNPFNSQESTKITWLHKAVVCMADVIMDRRRWRLHC